MADTSKQQERNGRNAISSSNDAPDSCSGLVETLNSIQARPRLWHIWVMCFTLGLLDFVPNQPLRQTRQRLQFSEERVCRLSIYTQDWYQLHALGKLLASCWLFWLFFPRDTALEVVYVCCNHGIRLLYLTCCKRLIAEFFMWRYVTCCSLVNWKSVSDTWLKWNLAHASCVSLCWVKSIWKAWLYTKKLLRLEEEFCCLPCQATIA